MGGIGLAFLAGLLTALSPCVLPLVPIVLAAALGKHRFGPVALAAGLSLSFAAIGLFVATIGFSAGLDQDLFRAAGAVLLILVGVVLLVPPLQSRLAVVGAPIGNWIQPSADRSLSRGWTGQFGVGLLLGAIWSPCVGPTLGAASVLAARSENLGIVALTMAAFGVGAALPLLAIGLMSREALTRWRGRLLAVGTGGKAVMGVLMVGLGVLIVTNLDKRLEAVLVEASPAWLTELTTRF